MNKRVVYTSLAGKGATIKNPAYIFEGWDYICFSDDAVSTPDNDVWKIKPIPSDLKDRRRRSRVVKLQPHLFLQEYEYSLWIDANIEIVSAGFEQRINQLINDNEVLTLIHHPFRQCIYEEAYACIRGGKDHHWKIRQLINHLKKQNFPENYGLYENGVLLRKHNDEKLKKINAEWWDLYHKYSERDQLSLTYLIWKYQLKVCTFFDRGISVRNSEMIIRHEYKNSFNAKIRKRWLMFVNGIYLNYNRKQ